jgi:hypothetical protein
MIEKTMKYNEGTIARQRQKKVVVFLVLVFTLTLTKSMTEAMDVKWTPNPSDESDGGPLPLSSQQRQQLLQLEQTISQSPNPQATLDQIASSNSMTSTELHNMLQRNKRDMEQVGSSSDQGTTSSKRTSSMMITTVLWNTITMILTMIWQLVCQHQRPSLVIGILLFTIVYLYTMVIPHDGLVLNQDTSRNLLTKGPTAVFDPPTTYLQQLLEGHDERYQSKLFHMIPSKHSSTDDLEEADEDEEHDSIEQASVSRDLWKQVDFSVLNDPTDDENIIDNAKDVIKINHKGDMDSAMSTKTWRPPASKHKRKPNPVQLVVSSQYSFDVAVIQAKISPSQQKQRSRSSQNKTDDDNMIIQEQIVDWCMYHATNICQTQEITEFLGSSLATQGRRRGQRPSILKLLTTTTQPQGNTKGIIVVPGMGDFGRYAMLPLFIHTNEDDDDDDNDNGDNVYLALSVAKGAHFDGQIHISIQPIMEATFTIQTDTSPILPSKFLVRASIVVPNKGKEPNRKIAQRITHDLVSSIVQSIQLRTEQSMVRSKQSSAYGRLASKRAQDRRRLRTTIERQMEEMAIDRRRKWQHKNPSGTSNYRPSGERMRNPNSAISFR